MIRHVTRMTMMNMTTQSNKHPSCENPLSCNLYVQSQNKCIFYTVDIIKGDYDGK